MMKINFEDTMATTSILNSSKTKDDNGIMICKTFKYFHVNKISCAIEIIPVQDNFCIQYYQ